MSIVIVPSRLRFLPSRSRNRVLEELIVERNGFSSFSEEMIGEALDLQLAIVEKSPDLRLRWQYRPVKDRTILRSVQSDVVLVGYEMVVNVFHTGKPEKRKYDSYSESVQRRPQRASTCLLWNRAIRRSEQGYKR